MNCYPLSLSVAIILILLFTTGLMETAPIDWTQVRRFY
jgi:hypothetical protein